MRHRVIARLRRESNLLIGTVVAIALLLTIPTASANRVATALSVAAFLAPMAVAAVYYGAEARRLASPGRSRSGMRPLLQAGRAVCLVLLLAAAADLLWRWDRLEPVAVACSAVLVVAAVLSYLGYFRLRVAWTDAGGIRLARASMHRTLTTKGKSS